MSAEPPSNPNPIDELKTDLQESPPLDELKAGLADKQPLVQNAQPRYSFGWFDKWLLAIPIAIGIIILFLLWSSISGTPVPTTATLQTPAPDATLQVGEPLTITGTAPPNSTVQIYNHGQLVAETTADENGNFVVRFNPTQPGAYELTAVATTADGTQLESPPIQFVIADESGQTALGPTLPASTQTAIAAAGASGTSVAGSSGGTPVPGAEGAQGATTPGAEDGTPAPTTVTLQTLPADATLQAGEPLTITGTAPPNSTVQIYNHGQLVAETTADADGNFVVSFIPLQPGAYELTAVTTTADGTTLESPAMQFVITDESGATPVPGTEGGAQGGTPAPTTTTLQTLAADGTPQAGEPVTITGTAPPNSSVQIYNHDELVAETTADADGNFVVSFVPGQAGAYELTAVTTTADGTTLESPPIQFVIAEGTGQTPAPGQTAPANQTTIASAGATATSVAAANGTSVPGADGGTPGGAQGAITPGAEGGAQGGTPVPGTEGGTQGATTPGAEGGTSAPTSASLQPPAPDATLQVGESLTISGTAPPNSTVQIYNQGELVAEATADENGNFVVSVVPAQTGAYELTAVATAPDGTTLESPPIQFVIADGTGQTTPSAEGGTPAPTSASLQPPAPDASLQVGESLTITGTAPPNSTVQIYNQGELVAEATADENGNFVVSVVPAQAGAYELTAVATTADGTQLESAPIQLVIAEGTGQTPAPGQTAPANQTAIASAGATATDVAVANGTSVPGADGGTPGGAQGATTPDAQGGTESSTTPGADGGAQGAATPGAEGSVQGATTPGTEGGTPGATTPGAEDGAQGSATPGPNGALTPGAAGAPGTPPTVNVMSGQWLAPGATISGTGVPASVVTVYLNDTEIGTATVDADGTWQFILPMGLAPGNYGLRIVSESPDTSATGSSGGTESVTESKEVQVIISPALLPVTGGKRRFCWPW